MDDPFLPDEEDPMETEAIESCLWEIVMLQSHYQPNVATLAKIISEQFTKQSYNLEDFLDHSYASVSISTYWLTTKDANAN
jgi:U3 small nucleolar RNA-associated protein 19